MADEKKKTFEDLLKDAPEAPGAGAVSLVGALARSKEPGKFVLTTTDGQQVTLDTDAVKSFTVLSGAIGQTLVRIEFDSARVPESLRLDPNATSNIARTIVYLDYTGHFDPTLFYLDQTGYFDHTGLYETIPVHDVSFPGTPSDPIYPGGGPIPSPDPGPLMATQALRPGVIHTIPELDNTGYFDHSGYPDVTGFIQDASIPGYSDPIGSGTPFAGGGATPFVLATPHHADPSLIAAMQGGMAAPPYAAYRKPPFIDRPKRPQEDGTFPPHWTSDF